MKHYAPGSPNALYAEIGQLREKVEELEKELEQQLAAQPDKAIVAQYAGSQRALAKVMEELAEARQLSAIRCDAEGGLALLVEYLQQQLTDAKAALMRADGELSERDAEIAVMREALEACEWTNVAGRGAVCPNCWNTMAQGHTDGCIVAKALKEAGDDNSE